jgi:FixJ family two-component response regulator
VISSSGVRTRVPYGKLLVVEDEDAVFRCLERIVSRYRPVRHATTFEQAVAELKGRTRFCGFLFDRSLGDRERGGIELLELVQRDYGGVPAALVTGHVTGAVVNEVASLGATMLSKPLDEQALMPFLQRVIAREHGFAKDFSERLNAVSRGFRFSPREHEILAWFVAGGTREGYLAFSGMAESTLKTHVKHILAKSSTSSLAETVSIALRRVVVRTQRSEPPAAAAAPEQERPRKAARSTRDEA